VITMNAHDEFHPLTNRCSGPAAPAAERWR